MPVKRFPRAVSEATAPVPEAESAFWEAWNAHCLYLNSLCLRWMGDADEANEALSGAMLRAWEGSGGRIHEIGNLRAWLTAITKHHCIDLLRARNRSVVHVAEQSALVEFADAVAFSQDSDPERGFIRAEDFQAVLLQMDGLPERLRTVLEMRGFLGMEYSEIAGRLQISQETARKRVQEARRMLKDALHFGPPHVQRPTERLPDDGGIRSHLARAANPNMTTSGKPAPVPHHALTISLGGRELVFFRDTRQHRLQQQIHTLNAYLSRHPGGWMKRLERAELRLQSGDVMAAFREMETAFSKQDQRFDIRLRLVGLSQLLLGKVDAALFSLGQKQPGLEDQHMLLQALAFQADGKAERAIEVLRQAAIYFPDSLACAHALMRLLLQVGDHGLLESICLEGIRRHPLDRTAHFFRSCLPATHPEMLVWLEDTQRKFPREALANLQLLRAGLALKDGNKPVRLPLGIPATLEWELNLLQAFAKGGKSLLQKRFRAVGGDDALKLEWEPWMSTGGMEEMPQPCWVHYLPEILI